MSDLDVEQNERIRMVETRVNDIENQMNRLIGELSQTMKILKILFLTVLILETWKI